MAVKLIANYAKRLGLPGIQLAGIFDHQLKRSVFKEKGRGKLDLLRFCLPDSNR
jgi:hypothetical protein